MNHPLLRDLSAALVLSFGHFLWIGTLIAIVTSITVKRQQTADARYRAWLGGLIAMAASPFVTLVVLMAMPSVDAVPASTPAALVGEPVGAATHGDAADEARRMDALVRPLPGDNQVGDGKQHRDVSEDGRTRASILQGDRAANDSDEQRPATTHVSQREPAWWRDYAPLVTSLYLIGVALMGLRLSLGLWGGRRLRNHATLITDRSLLDALQRQADALGMKFVPALAYCERVTVPTVLGILKPMVLLPVSLASGLAPDQIESVLAHELAHLRRYDHLVNLMQCVIESVLFFHPAVWWVSRRIRDEREHCCDDLVIASGAVPLDYAASLLRVAELSREAEQQRGHHHRRSFAAVSLFATGDRPSTLRQRIARLLGDPVESRVRLRHPWTACGLLAASLSIAWFTAAVQRPIAAQPEETDQGESAAQADESAAKPDRKLNDDDSAAASEFNHWVTEDQKRNLIELRDRVRKIVPQGWQIELRFGSISMDRPGRKQDAHWVRWPEAMLYFNNEDTTSEIPPIADGTQIVSLGLCKLGYATLTIPQPMLAEWPESRAQLQAVLPEADDAARQVVQPLKAWPLVVGTLRYEDGSPVKGALVGPVGRAKVPLGDDGRYRVRVEPNWGRFFVSLKDVRDWPSNNSPPRDPAYLREVLDIKVIEVGPSVVRRNITLNRTQLRTVKLWWNGPTTKGRLRLYSNPPKDWLTDAAVPPNERPAGDKQVAVPGERQLLVISRTLDVTLEHGKQFVINDVPPGDGHVGITLAETLQPLAWPLTGGEEDEQLVYNPADTGSVDVKVLGEDGAPLKQQAILNVMRLLPNMGFGVFNSAAGGQCDLHRPVFDAKTQTHRISHLQPGRYQANVTLESLFGAPVLFDVFKDEVASVVLSISQTPVAALPDEKPKPEKYSAKLPNGVEVELAGIAHANVATDDASKRRKDDAWWSADGVKLGAPPFMQNILTVAKGVAHEYEFAIRLKSPNPAEPVRNLITSSRVSSVPNPPGGSVSSQGPAPLEDGGTAVWKIVHVANMLENKPVAINVFVSDEPLVTAGFVDLDGETRPQQPLDAKIDALRNLIQIVRVEKLENETILRCKLPPDIAERMEFQFVAIDTRDEAHVSRGSDSGVFKLAAADIKHFEIRLRPMTHKVTFENVSLVPGQITNVKVKVEPIDLLALNGLEFLTPYPKLHGLSLDMTEPQFLEIVQRQELQTRKTVKSKTGEGEQVTHHIGLGDGHTLIVMFGKDAKCSGIQRVRGDDDEAIRAGSESPDPALDPTAGLPNSDEETNQPNNANGDLRSNPAAGSGEDPRPAQVSDPGIVTGRVVRADDGTPLSDVKILLRHAQKYVTNSDEKGQFRFENIPPGEYRIWAHKENLVSSKERLFGAQVVGSTGGRFAPIQLPMKPGKQVRVTVTSAETGQPIEGANVRFGYPDRRLQVTGKDGITVVPGLLGEPYEITVEATGHAREERHIELAQSGDIANVPVPLSEGGTIQGTVTDESGQPLDQVDVVFRDAGSHGGYYGESPWSNAAGEFRHHFLPLNTAIKVSVTKSGFLSQGREVVLSADQRKMQLKFQMVQKPKGGSIAGIVTDQTGKPVAGAKVFDPGKSIETPKATTDAAGRFVLHDMQQSLDRYEIVTRAKGFSPARLSVKPGPESKPQQVAVTLQPGHKIRARVQTLKGEPLPGVYVEANGGIQEELGDSTRTDSDGIFEFDTLPKESSFRFYTAGYSTISDRSLELDGTEIVTVVMRPAAVIRGRVVDAESGQPIQHFNVRLGFTPERKPDDAVGSFSSELGNPGLTVESKDGLFTIGELSNRLACSLTVQAEGYERTVIRRVVAWTTREPDAVKVALTRLDPAKVSSLSGQVLDHRGEPVTGAQLRLIVLTPQPTSAVDRDYNWYQIKSGELAARPECEQFLSLVSDAEGRFEFKKIVPGKLLQLAYWGDKVPQGRSQAFDKTQASVNQTITIKLPEPAKVTGTFDLTKFPDAGSITLELRPSAFHQYEVKLKEGQTAFEFRDLPPGEYALTVRSKPVRSSENERLFSLFPLAARKLDLTAGETRKIHFDKPDNAAVNLGGIGDVKVKVETNEPLSPKLDFLKPYPKLHGLSLDMTEPQFLEIVQQQELKTTKSGKGATRTRTADD